MCVFFYDAPWLKGRPYRLMLRLSYRAEPTGQLWGLGESTLRSTLPHSLSQYERAIQTPTQINGQWTTQKAFHDFAIQQWQLWTIGEKIAYRGLMRLLGGLRWQQDRVSSLAGRTYPLKAPSGEKVEALQLPTLLDSLALQPPLPYVLLPVGSPKGRLFLGGAVVWDSRDFELSPNSGWVIEVGHESRLPTSLPTRLF